MLTKLRSTDIWAGFKISGQEGWFTCQDMNDTYKLLNGNPDLVTISLPGTDEYGNVRKGRYKKRVSIILDGFIINGNFIKSNFKTRQK